MIDTTGTATGAWSERLHKAIVDGDTDTIQSLATAEYDWCGLKLSAAVEGRKSSFGPLALMARHKQNDVLAGVSADAKRNLFDSVLSATSIEEARRRIADGPVHGMQVIMECVYGGEVDVLQVIVKYLPRGADDKWWRRSDADGGDPLLVGFGVPLLFQAAHDGQTEMCRYLLSQGMDPRIKFRDESVMLWALGRGIINPACADELRQAGVDPFEVHQLPCHVGICEPLAEWFRGHKALAKAEAGTPNAVDEYTRVCEAFTALKLVTIHQLHMQSPERFEADDVPSGAAPLLRRCHDLLRQDGCVSRMLGSKDVREHHQLCIANGVPHFATTSGFALAVYNCKAFAKTCLDAKYVSRGVLLSAENFQFDLGGLELSQADIERARVHRQQRESDHPVQQRNSEKPVLSGGAVAPATQLNLHTLRALQFSPPRSMLNDADSNMKEGPRWETLAFSMSKARQRDALAMICDTHGIDLLRTKVLMHIVNLKWEAGGQRVYMQQLFLYVVFAICTTVFTSSIPHDIDEHVDTYLWVFAGVATVTSITTLVKFERFQFQQLGAFNYFTSLRNLVDVCVCLLWLTILLLVAVSRGTQTHNQQLDYVFRGVTAIEMGLVCYVILDYGSIHRRHGHLINIMYRMAYEALPFFVMLFVIVLGFTCALHPLMTMSTDETLSYGDMLVLMLRWALNDPDYDVFDSLPDGLRTLARALYFVFNFLVILLLINMLIAIMGNQYNAVIEDVEGQNLKQFAEKISDLQRNFHDSEFHTYWMEVLSESGRTQQHALHASGQIIGSDTDLPTPNWAATLAHRMVDINKRFRDQERELAFMRKMLAQLVSAQAPANVALENDCDDGDHSVAAATSNRPSFIAHQ